jgi:hypothetical protein
MSDPTLITPGKDSPPTNIVPFLHKTYVDGNTLIAWLKAAYDMRADRSKLVDLRRQGMPKRQFSPRCIRYNLDAVAAWFEERELPTDHVEELTQRALREARHQAHQKRGA